MPHQASSTTSTTAAWTKNSPDQNTFLITDLPAEVLARLFTTILIRSEDAPEENLKSLLMLLEAFPELSRALIVIADDPKSCLLQASQLQVFSLEEYDANWDHRAQSATLLRVFSFTQYTRNLSTQKFSSSIHSLYGRHLGPNCVAVVEEVSRPSRGIHDSFISKMEALTSRAGCPLLKVPASHTTTTHFKRHHNYVGHSYHAFDEVRLDIRELEETGWSSYPKRLDSISTEIAIKYPFHHTEELCLLRAIAIPHPEEALMICDELFPSLKTLSVAALPSACVWPDDEYVTTEGRFNNDPSICFSDTLQVTAKSLTHVYYSFETCILPLITVLPGEVAYVYDDPRYRFYWPSIPQSKIPTPYNFYTERLPANPDIRALELFTLENRRWSINHPFGQLCSYALFEDYPNCDPVVWMTAKATEPEELVRQEWWSKNSKLIGVPAIVALVQITWELTESLEWWCMSHSLPVPDSLDCTIISTSSPFLCPVLKRLKICALAGWVFDPEFSLNAPVLEELELVALPNSEHVWDVEKLLNRKPPERLRRAMIAKYNTTEESLQSLKELNLTFIMPYVKELAVIGYFPDFMFVEKPSKISTPLDWSGLDRFWQLRSLTLDATMFIKPAIDSPPETVHMNLLPCVFPWLKRLKLVVPGMSNSTHFEDTFIYKPWTLMLSLPMSTKEVTLSSHLIGQKIFVDGQQLTSETQLRVVKGLEYTWRSSSYPWSSKKFILDLKTKGRKDFAHEWSYDNCLYDSWVPEKVPCEHYQRSNIEPKF